jgi:hypothetical protein
VILVTLWARRAPYVLGAAAGLSVLLTFRTSQPQAGRAKVEAENAFQTLSNMEVRHAVEGDVRRAGEKGTCECRSGQLTTS